MKLHTVVGSPNCRRVEAVINYLDLDIEKVYYDIFAGGLQTPEYLELNPNHMVPVLEDDDFVLNESNAIMCYLADKVPGNTLYLADAKVRAEINRWLYWEAGHFNKALGSLAFETMFKPMFFDQEPIAERVAWMQENLERFAAVLDKHLEGRKTMVGDVVTIADYAVGTLEMFADKVPFDWSPYTNILAFYEKIRGCKYWASTAAESMEALGRLP